MVLSYSNVSWYYSRVLFYPIVRYLLSYGTVALYNLYCPTLLRSAGEAGQRRERRKEDGKQLSERNSAVVRGKDSFKTSNPKHIWTNFFPCRSLTTVSKVCGFRLVPRALARGPMTSHWVPSRPPSPAPAWETPCPA